MTYLPRVSGVQPAPLKQAAAKAPSSPLFGGESSKASTSQPEGAASLLTPRNVIISSVGLTGLGIVGAAIATPWALAALPIWAIAAYQTAKDARQDRRAIPHNYPLIGHIRDMLEDQGPKLRWSLFHNDWEGRPINRKQFELIKQRAKGETDTVAWGTQRNLKEVGMEAILHSLSNPKIDNIPQIRIGGPDCRQPYDTSILNISGMSFGALSPEATMLNAMASKIIQDTQGTGCYQNTGEGGIAPQHLGFDVDIEHPGFDMEYFIDRASPMTRREVDKALTEEAKIAATRTTIEDTAAPGDKTTGASAKRPAGSVSGPRDRAPAKADENRSIAEITREMKQAAASKPLWRKLVGRKLREETLQYVRFPSGDLFWNIGTGYFGCRNADGTFNEAAYARKARLSQVKGIELKLSQGAKPGLGGKLPGSKVTPGIAKLRGIEEGKDCNSPAGHSAFSTPVEMMRFIGKLRDLSGGKPVGFKLCVGKKHEFLAIVKAMQATGIYPDFITIDGAEGGTGAGVAEFSNSVGMPLDDALVFVNNALVGAGVRDRIRLIASGLIVSADDIYMKLARGADIVNSGRAMMVAGGCIMAMHCNGPVKGGKQHECPVGYATQNPTLRRALDPYSKSLQVASFHNATVQHVIKELEASGHTHPSQVRPSDVVKRTDLTTLKTLDEVYEWLKPGVLNAASGNDVPESFRRDWLQADPNSFQPRELPPVDLQA